MSSPVKLAGPRKPQREPAVEHLDRFPAASISLQARLARRRRIRPQSCRERGAGVAGPEMRITATPARPGAARQGATMVSRWVMEWRHCIAGRSLAGIALL